MLWLAIFCCYCIAQVQLLVCDDNLAAFSGGYVPMKWPKLSRHSFAELVVEFQPVSKTGVLFYMEFILASNSSVVSMLSYHNHSLQLTVKKGLHQYKNGSVSNNVSYDSKNTLRLRVIKNKLRVQLNSDGLYTYALQRKNLNTIVKDLLIGGTRDFTIYPNFPVRSYFVGLLSDISVASNCENIVNKDRGQAVILDHCTHVTPSFVKFNIFSVPLTSISVDPANHFTVSFIITTQNCVGQILHLADGSFALDLNANKLVTRITNRLGHAVECNSTAMVANQTTKVTVVVGEDRVQYIIEGVQSRSCDISLRNVTFSGTLMIGARQNTSTPFAGYLQQLYWNGAELNLAGLAKSQDDSCTGIGPVKCNNQGREGDHLPPSCIQPLNCTLWDYPIQWSTFDMSVHRNLSVREEGSSQLEKTLFKMFSVPPCLSQEQQESLDESIIFIVLEPLPAYGKITPSNEEFSFSNLTAVKYEQPDTDIEVSSDTIRLLVQARCGPSVLYSKQLTLYVDVKPHNDAPKVKTSSSSIVVGTSRLITRDIILMHDLDTSPEHLRCTGINIRLSPGGTVSGHFEWTDPNITKPIVPFYQTDIDAGRIALRLYLNATRKSVVALTFTDGKSINFGSLNVYGINGTIRLMENRCVELTEGHNVFISSSSLVAGTNFDDQHPVITYLLTTFPKFGEISLVHNNQFIEHNVSKFTQQDIDLGKLVYLNTKQVHNSTKDCFDFKLMVEEYSGDNDSFCVKIVVEEHLPLVDVTLSIRENISLNEGEVKSITIHNLAINITPKTVTRNGLEMPLPDSLQLFLVFTEMPKYGILYLGTSNGSRAPITSNVTLEQFAAGQLLYDHQELEEHSDSFKIRLVLDVTSYIPIRLPDHNPEYVVFINVMPVNNKHPIVLVHSNLSLTENSYQILTNHILNITDADRPEEDMEVFVLPTNTSSPTGYFAYIKNISIPIDRFSVSNLNKKHVAYKHNLGSALEESYIIIVSDGVHNTTAELRVVAQPLELIVRPVLPCSINLDLLEADMVQICVDLQPDNHDIHITTTSADLLYQNNTGFFPVEKFTKRDLNLKRIWYAVIDNRTRVERKQIELEFSIGHAVVASQFEVCISLLPYPQLISSNPQSISLPEHGEVVVGKSVLHIANTRNKNISFGLEYELVTAPLGGQLVLVYSDLSSRPARHFSQDFVNNGSVRYHNHNYSGGSDMFVLTLSNQFYKYTENITVQIMVSLLRLNVVNNGFVATEGANHTISTNDLYAEGPPGYDIVFSITSSPKFGYISVGNTTKASRFTKDDLDKGLVVYRNDGDEHYYDSMNITIKGIPGSSQDNDNITETDTTYYGTVNITIDLVNDHTPRPWNESVLQVVNGHTAVITSYAISFQDDDINMNISLLRYLVTFEPNLGEVVFVSNNSRADNFLQLSIFNHEIGYHHNKRDSTDYKEKEFIVLTVSDGNNSVLHILHISVLPYTISPTTNSTVVLDEGNSSKISDKNILFLADQSIPTANDSEYIYNVTKMPEHGELSKHGSSCGCIFTQEDLKNGSIVYQHDGSDSTSDYFEFVVTVRGYSTSTMTLVITVNPIDDEPPTINYMSQLLINFYSTIYFNNSILNASDTEAPTSDLLFTIETFPKFGRILCGWPGRTQQAIFDFTQLKINHEVILYKQETVLDGNWIDTITLSLTDGKNKYNGLIEISIVLIPPVLPVIVKETELPEGEIERLTADHIIVDHPYLSTLEFYINVTERLKYGKLFSYENSQLAQYFNSTAMKNNTIFYVNFEDNEAPQDFFKFRVTAGGLTSEEKKYVFKIIQRNDENPTIEKNRVVFIWAGETKLITRDYLLAEDKDTNPSNKLTFIITEANSSFGYFTYSDAPLTPIANFSQDDIDAGIVVFKSNPINDSIEINIDFTLNDGNVEHNLKGIMTYEINILTVAVSSLSVVVKMNKASLIRFQATFIDDNEKREIFYEVDAAGRLGVVMDTVSGDIVTNFTQKQMDNLQIIYQHTAMDQWEEMDSINFTVYGEFTEPVLTTLKVKVVLTNSNTTYLAVSGALGIDEGGKICLNDSVLDARNVLYNAWKNSNESFGFRDLSIQYNIFNPPAYGNLTINNVSVYYFNHVDLKNSTRVCYHHDGSETNRDSFNVTISIIFNSSVWYHNNTVVTVPISIRAVNDEIPVFDGAIDRITDKWYLFTDAYDNTSVIQPDELHLTDIDTPDDQLFYIILDNSGGQYISADKPITNFTQEDINRRRVQYVPKTSNSTSTFYFTDGSNPSLNYTIHYYQIDLELDAKVVQELYYFQNESSYGITLTTTHLYSSTNGYKSDTIYSITSQPVHGNLVKESSGQLQQIESFTQSDIDGGLVRYNVTDTSSYTDDVTMEITNRHESRGPYTLVFLSKASISIDNKTVLSLSPTGNEQPLPVSLLNAHHLASLDPTFTVVQPPIYGHLKIKSERKRSTEAFTFTWTQFSQRRILYSLKESVFNSSENASNEFNITEVILVTVKVTGMQTGIANLSFTITNEDILPSATVAASPTPHNSPYTRRSAFTVFALVPILGVPSFILLVVAILIGFWYSQKLKEKRRWAAARGSSAICMGSHSQFSLPRQTFAASEIDHHSDQNSALSNSDEGISMPMDHLEENDIDPTQYVDDQYKMSNNHSTTPYHPLHTARDSTAAESQHASHMNVPILKSTEYWL